MAVRRKRLELTMPVESWIRTVFSHPAVQIAPLTAEIAVRSCFLPGELHADPWIDSWSRLRSKWSSSCSRATPRY